MIDAADVAAPGTCRPDLGADVGTPGTWRPVLGAKNTCRPPGTCRHGAPEDTRKRHRVPLGAGKTCSEETQCTRWTGWIEGVCYTDVRLHQTELLNVLFAKLCLRENVDHEVLGLEFHTLLPSEMARARELEMEIGSRVAAESK